MILSWLLAAACAASASGDGLRIKVLSDATRVEVVADLPQALVAKVSEGKLDAASGEKLLRWCLVDPETGREGPPIFGSYERKGQTLLYRPRHPLLPGQRYRAVLCTNGREQRSAEYRVPDRPATARAVVEKTYPTSEELPANLLKFYLYFSRPMRESRAIFDHIELRKENGEPVLDPWRRTELWNEDNTRLTLWIHPGRVKEGVNLREQFGPVLEPGKKYTLVVGTELLDSAGQPLASEFKRTFRVTAPLRSLPRVEDWQLQTPAGGTAAPLQVAFPRPLDHALLGRFLTVVDAAGKPVAGRSSVGAGERSWQFFPEAPWHERAYTLSVDERLEDLAGNTPGRIFDLDLRTPVVDKPLLARSFRPRK